MTKTIKIAKGYETIVDDDWYEKIPHTGERPRIRRGLIYVYRMYYIDGKAKAQSLHRIITNAKNGDIVDHINGDTLDNRNANLRIVTSSQSAANRKSFDGSSSKYKGVSWDKKSKAWRVQIQLNKKKIALGCSFKNEVDAAIAYNEAAKKYHREFAKLNEIFPASINERAANRSAI